MRKSNEAPQELKPVGLKARFVGLVGAGKERYQVHLIEMVGEKVVKRTILHHGREEKVNGEVVCGDSIAVARSALLSAVGKHLTDVSDLWRK